jgi:hypothetical protein
LVVVAWPDENTSRPAGNRAAYEKAPDQGLSAVILPKYDVDLFDQPVEPVEPIIPRRGSAEYLKHFNTLPLPHGWKFWTLAPRMRRIPTHIESIWVKDHEGEFCHLFVDQHTGQEWHLDLESGWSS